MNKIILMSLFAISIVISSLSVENSFANAQDIYVYSDSWDGSDKYIMNETINGKSNNGGRYIEVYVKTVKNEKLLSKVKWTFIERGHWSYETSDMRVPHAMVVNEGESSYKILNYCLSYLGWSY